MDQTSVSLLQGIVSNGPWACAAAFLGWKIIVAWTEDRRRVDAIIAQGLEDRKAVAVTLQEISDRQQQISDTQHEMARDLVEIRREVFNQVK